MILTYRLYRSYDTPIHIDFMSTFIGCLFDDVYTESEKENFRLFDDGGHLIGRAATYWGV